ncbi:MAG: PIG-L family deacetylase [Caldilinea sp.]|jgi:LmbE family N-acetylglucosaminyl deacetylase|uniref:PIG-L deacetylase family protein n=1 Tax=Caldilinea sp. TaxID=2293560 RepID=UPI00309DACFB
MSIVSSKRAFAIVAHPDDLEFMMAGTLILLRQAGYEIHCMTVADGSLGSVRWDAVTTASIRRQESIEAAALLGAVYHESICPDMGIFYEPATLRRLAAVVREVAPTILLTHPPVDYMEDHMNTCRLALSAAFVRGAPNYVTDPPRPPVDAPVTIYHAMPYGLRDPMGRVVHAEYYVDISDVLPLKRRMLEMHRSQKEWLEASQGIGAFVAHMEAMSRRVGELSGRFLYAEGWTRHLSLGYCREEDDPLVDALGERVLHLELK